MLRVAPMRDVLNLLTRAILAGLPDDARVLCVGVGTGQELVYLAREFPGWQFTAVDPAPAMLDVCRRNAIEAGIDSRCTWHEGYLESLPSSEPFHAATCLLVSHFLTRQGERRALFRGIARRLGVNGTLVSADLASDMSTAGYLHLREAWISTLRYAGFPDEEIAAFIAAYGSTAAVLPPSHIASIIASGGFDTPVLFLQTLLIHAWYARKTG